MVDLHKVIRRADDDVTTTTTTTTTTTKESGADVVKGAIEDLYSKCKC